MKTNYNIKPMFDSSLSSNQNWLSRILNSFIRGDNTEILLPKIVVVILEDDLTENINRHISYIYGVMVHWLSSELNKCVSNHKDHVPPRAKRADYPTFIWLAPTQNINYNNNEKRAKMEKTLKTMLDVPKSHIMMRLIKVWEFSDQNAFRNGHMTELGFNKFWKSVDSAIQFWDRHLAPQSNKTFNTGLNQTEPSFTMKKSFSNDKFHWNKDQHRPRGHYNRQLPPPARYFKF